MSDINPVENQTTDAVIQAQSFAPANEPTPNPITGETPGQQRIEGTPFQTQEALIDGWKNLQAELTRLKQEQATVPAEEPAAEDSTQTPNETAQPDEAGDFDWLSVTQQFDAEKGEWNASVIEKLEAVGIPQEALDRVRGLEQIAAQYFVGRAEQIAGGAEQWKAVQAYITEQMPQMVDDLNHPEKFEFVIEAAMARMGATNATSPSREPSPAPGGVSNPGIATEPYLLPGSPEAQRAMTDPKFRTDPKYAQEVRDQVARGAIIARSKR